MALVDPRHVLADHNPRLRVRVKVKSIAHGWAPTNVDTACTGQGLAVGGSGPNSVSYIA